MIQLMVALSLLWGTWYQGDALCLMKASNASNQWYNASKQEKCDRPNYCSNKVTTQEGRETPGISTVATKHYWFYICVALQELRAGDLKCSFLRGDTLATKTQNNEKAMRPSFAFLPSWKKKGTNRNRTLDFTHYINQWSVLYRNDAGGSRQWSTSSFKNSEGSSKITIKCQFNSLHEVYISHRSMTKCDFKFYFISILCALLRLVLWPWILCNIWFDFATKILFRRLA